MTQKNFQPALAVSQLLTWIVRQIVIVAFFIFIDNSTAYHVPFVEVDDGIDVNCPHPDHLVI